MKNIRFKLISMLAFGMVLSAGTAQELPKTDDHQAIDNAYEQTLERVRDLQNYKPTPEELAACSIRVKKVEYISKKTGKLKLALYKTYRGKQNIKDYMIKDSDEDGQLDYFMEIFRFGEDGKVSLLRNTKDPLRRYSVVLSGALHISAILSSKNSVGKYDELLIMSDDGRFIDLFRRDAEGLLQPVSPEEYLKNKREAEAIAPMGNAMMNAIKAPIKAQKAATDKSKSDNVVQAPPSGKP